VEPPRHWTPGEGRNGEIWRNSRRDFTNFQRESAVKRGRRGPVPKRRSEALDFSYLQSGGAVGSRPVTGLPASTKCENTAEFLLRLYKLSDGRRRFGGPGDAPCPKRRSEALDFSNLQSGGAVWSLPATDSRRAPKCRKVNSRGDFSNFQRESAGSGGPATPRSRKGDQKPWTSPTYRAGEQCGAARHWTPGEREMPKIGGISTTFFKLSEGKCSFGGAGPPGPKRKSEALDFSNLQSEGAVWSRPVTGFPASAEMEKTRRFDV
jgi:hypothetical protein